MGTRDVFSEEELAQLRAFPEIGRVELIRHFTLTDADEGFVRKFRTGRNVLGAAVQLCALPWLGYVPDDVTAAPAAAVGRLSQRLGVPMGELREYGEREQTRTEHLRQVAAYAGWRTMDTARWKELDEFLFARAMEHDSPKLLFRLACEFLTSSRVVRPGVILILKRVAAARSRARDETWARVAHLLSQRRRDELDLPATPSPSRRPNSESGRCATPTPTTANAGRPWTGRRSPPRSRARAVDTASSRRSGRCCLDVS